MIEAIKSIGEYALLKEGKSVDNPLEIVIEDPSNYATKNVIFIKFRERNNEFTYEKVELEEYSSNKLNKYLYRKGSPNGTDITPTSMITDVTKTFNNKTLKWFKDFNKITGDNDFIVRLGNCLRDNKETINEDLIQMGSKENNILSIKINNKYIGDDDFKIFQNILVEKAKENYYYTKSFSGENKISKSQKPQICSVCNSKQDEVYGFVNTYNFYTVDKKGFVSGGFLQKDAWKNYPVCLNCALTLDNGKKYVGSNLRFNFYGINYLLIPQFVSNVNEDTRNEIFKIIENQNDPSFRKKDIVRLTSDEREILPLMSQQKNYLNLNFIFYEAPKGYYGPVFKILLHMEDILPSRLRKLFEVKEKIDKINIFSECYIPIYEDKKKIDEVSLSFNFEILRTFFPEIDYQTKQVVGYSKYFLDIVYKIFTNKNLDMDFLMNFIMRKIRKDFVEKYPTKISTIKGFMLLNFLNELEIIKYVERKIMDRTESNIAQKTFNENSPIVKKEINQKVNDFFNEFGSFFNMDSKKAIFLEGALVQNLLNIQRLPEVSNSQPGKEPFRTRLKGLKLDEKQIIKLFPEIQNKLEEYGKNYYKTLETIISQYFVSSGNDWKLSNDEINFYFVLGMNLSYIFKKKTDNMNGGEENE